MKDCGKFWNQAQLFCTKDSIAEWSGGKEEYIIRGTSKDTIE